MTIYIYILWVFLVTPGGMMAFSFPTGMEPRPSAFGAWSLGHWPTREVPILFLTDPQRVSRVCDEAPCPERLRRGIGEGQAL